VIFKTAAAAILDFQKFKILTVDALLGALVLNFIKIGQTVADGDLTVFSQHGGRPPS